MKSYQISTIRLGVSQCLLGSPVRYDGGTATNAFVNNVLGEWVEYVPVCPEVEMGMPVPRPAIRLVNDGQSISLIEPKSNHDYTHEMTVFSERRVRELEALELDGYILKSKSPSCGMERVSVYRGDQRKKEGTGLFARSLIRGYPNLPVEEEGRLNDPRLRENFIERIFAGRRWRSFLDSKPTRGKLIAFHSDHKLQLLSHNQAAYRRMGALVGQSAGLEDAALFREYETAFHNCLKAKTTVKAHCNVLQHALGYFKKAMGSEERALLVRSIEEFRSRLVPLVVPITLFRFNIEKYKIAYLQRQLYFEPHPKELMLRNHC